MLAGLGIAAVVDSLLMLGSPAGVGAILFVPAFGIPGTIVLLIAVGFATGATLRLVTGERQIAAGILAALAAAVTLVVLFVLTPHTPMNWIPALNADIGLVPAGPIAAAAAALALRRWWIRAIGAGVLLFAIAVPAVPAIIAGAEEKATADARDRAATEQYFDGLEMPAVTEWDGARLLSVSAGDWDAYAELITAGGGALEIRTYDASGVGPEPFVCWLMDDLGRSFDSTMTVGTYSGICEKTGTGAWRLVDGSARAVALDGRIVVVGSPTVDGEIADLGAQRPATPDEVAAAIARLHIQTREEYLRASSEMKVANG